MVPGIAERAVYALYRACSRAVNAAFSVLVVAAFLSGCTTESLMQSADTQGQSPTGFGKGDLTARAGQRGRDGGRIPATGRAPIGGELYPAEAGDRPSASANPPPGIVSTGEGYQLNFEAADVSAVVKAVLGDVLKLNYTIDPRVAGPLSISSARPVAQNGLMAVLETALKGINGTIVKNGAVYRITVATDAIGTGRVELRTVSSGYGVTVIPLRYVSVQTVAKLMENFVTIAGAIRAEPSLNLLLVSGSSQERRAALEAASVIDTDVMRAQSVGIFPLVNSSPQTVISEIQKIAATGEGGAAQGQVQFQPMERMNAVLVIARSAQVLKSTSRWIQRLDRADPGASDIRVFRLRHAPAAKVAAMLNEVFSGTTAPAGTGDQDALRPLRTGSETAGRGSAAPQDPAQGGSAPPGTGGEQRGLMGAAGIDPASAGYTQPGDSAPVGTGAIHVTADTLNNSLLIHATKAQYRGVEAAILQIDRPPEQVSIEATIAEVGLTNQLQYGVQAYLQSSDLGLGSGNGSGGFTSSSRSALINAVVPGANLILGSAVTPRIVLNALHALTNVKILSSPSLVVLDNQTATLQVGNQVAIKTQSAQSTDSATAPVINNIVYKDTGIILHVSPRIGANSVVTLDIQQEISNVVDNSGGTDGLTPTISQRRVKSAIAVPSGQTVMLAGLISNKASKGRSGLPGSEKWGLLGNLLSSNTGHAERNELVIFIKPQIIRDAFDAQAAAEEFRSRLGALNATYRSPRK